MAGVRSLGASLLAALAVALLGGCAGQRPVGELDPSLPSRAHLQVPFFAQTDYYCGPAALASVLNYRAVEVAPDALVPQVYLPGRKGSLSVEVKALPRRYGLVSYPLAPSLSDLLREVAAGNPVLVLQNLAFDWWPQWHYAVAVGFDLDARELILHSGTRENYRVTLRNFAATWRRTERWAVVAMPPSRIPATATPLAYLQAVNALERIDKSERAMTAYRSAAERWPGEPAVHSAAGAAALAAGDYRGARGFLERALTLRPDDAVTWNNFAYALRNTGCRAAAEAAVRRAVELAPADSRFQDSLRDIGATPDDPAGGTRCPSAGELRALSAG